MKEVNGKGLISGVPLKDADEKRKALEDRMPPPVIGVIFSVLGI
jgi:hypothetical protein